MMNGARGVDEDTACLQRAKELVDSLQDVDDKYPTISQLNLEGETEACGKRGMKRYTGRKRRGKGVCFIFYYFLRAGDNPFSSHPRVLHPAFVLLLVLHRRRC